jgi:predicted SnoaL-like aldol condensation-catalyzing enzyme
VGFRKIIVCSGIALGLMGSAFAQVPPTAAPDQMALLKSDNPKEAANKKLVFDMWRAVIQGGHVEMAEQYFTPGYIQHNPNVATGRDAMVKYMKESRPVKPIEPKITFPVIAIIAEGDFVTIATVSKEDDPTKKKGEKYLGTHFDMFRIENGKIAEHWDSVPKNPAKLHYNPNTQNEK